MQTEKEQTSKGMPGFLTAEAALILPAVLAIFLFFLYFLQVLFVEQELYSAGIKVLRQTAACGYLMKYADVQAELLWEAEGDYFYVTKEILELLQEAGYQEWFQTAVRRELTEPEMVEQVVKQGWKGISFWGSEAYAEDEMTVVQMSYRVEFPVFGNLFPAVRFEKCLMMRSFSGEGEMELGRGELMEEEERPETEEGYVFVTERGAVYHQNKNCIYLLRKAEEYSVSELEQLRNRNGAIYYACGSCDHEEMGEQIWVTSYGTRYHVTRSCIQLTRQAKRILFSEAENYRPCSRCAAQ